MSILEIAKLAEVSPATVSRVFNRPDQVSARTRERVLSAASDYGYHPNPAARALRTHRTRTLGVMLPTFGNPVFAECLEGIADCASRHGFAIMPVTSDYAPDQESQALQRLLARGVDGMVLVLRNPDNFQWLDRLRQRGLPFVLAYNQHPDYTCVGVDGSAEVAGVVARLCRLGHTRIAMVSGELAASDRARQRYEGYLTGIKTHRLEPMPLIEVDFMGTEMPALVSRLTQSAGRPTALICSNDLLALRSIRVAKSCGLSVPSELSVVGFDGIAIGQEISPALTTVVQPSRQIGQVAVELALEAIEQDSLSFNPVIRTLSCGYRTGETVATPRLGDQH